MSLPNASVRARLASATGAGANEEAVMSDQQGGDRAGPPAPPSAHPPRRPWSGDGPVGQKLSLDLGNCNDVTLSGEEQVLPSCPRKW